MPKMTFYTPGHKPQYGRSRWERYESLRVSGFTKTEARELSRATAPKTQEVINKMIVPARERLVNRFYKETNGYGTYRQFVKEVKNWYQRNKIAPKELKHHKGFDYTAQLYHRAENMLAHREGWRKGKYTPPPPKDSPEFDDWHEQDVQRRRRRKKSPTAKHYKGDVKAQRARAKARSVALRDLVQGDDDSPSTRAQKRQWIKDLKATAKREPERAGKLLQQAKSLGYTGRSF